MRRCKALCPFCERPVALSSRSGLISHHRDPDSNRKCLASGVYICAAVAQAEFLRVKGVKRNDD